MSAPDWARVKEVFHAALDRPSAEWPALLDERCGGDAALRAEVERLLAAHAQAGSFISTPPQVSAAPAADTVAMSGRVVDHYEVGRRIGAGGMGQVYEARDTELGRTVALKFVPGGDEEAQSRLRREARHASQLNHPHICTIYEVGRSYIVMEYVDGQPLSELIAAGALPAATMLRYGIQVADALAHAHQRGVIHRDLKSANIVVTPEGRAKVLDFGLARRVTGHPPGDLVHSHETLTAGGPIAGTLPYMAPELLRGAMADARSDVWALGVVLYEMATGKRPFAGGTAFELSAAILHEAPASLASAIPTSLQAVIARCLVKDPHGRYANGGEVLAALTAIERDLAAGSSRRRRRIAVALPLVVALLAVVVAWLRPSGRLPGREQWDQLTNFPDSVSQPSLSPDGRMVTFVRGPGTFQTEGQIYVKQLPDGEPRQLTDDQFRKMSPVFSPDGSQIVYTTIDSHFAWDTWTVPVSGGAPALWLRNASGLGWAGSSLLFSEIKSGNHMAIVMADQSRAASRDIYVPPHERGMGHRSYASPDRRWALVVEMDRASAWTPCRLVPLDGSSAGRQVGPPRAGCTFAGWSLDGIWMFFSSSAGGAYHLWRQRFPDGEPEQITSGATEEEGIALSPDGRSIVTAVGLKQRSMILHEGGRDRQVSLEGYAFNPKFSRDGTKLFYLSFKSGTALEGSSELWMVDLSTGRGEMLFPSVANAGLTNGAGGGSFDISPDGTRVVVSALDEQGKPRLWLLSLDRGTAPRQVPGVSGHQPKFGAGDEIFFRSDEGTQRSIYRVFPDGSNLRKAIPIYGDIIGVSEDGQWLGVWVYQQGATLFPTSGGQPVRLWGRDARPRWTADGHALFLSISSLAGTYYSAGRTYVIPLEAGKMLPPVPEGGFNSEAELAKLPGVRIIEAADVTPGPTADIYAFSRETTQRNLYRIPLP